MEIKLWTTVQKCEEIISQVCMLYLKVITKTIKIYDFQTDVSKQEMPERKKQKCSKFHKNVEECNANIIK